MPCELKKEGFVSRAGHQLGTRASASSGPHRFLERCGGKGVLRFRTAALHAHLPSQEHQATRRL